MRTYREIFALPEFRVLFLARCVTMAAISIGGLALGTTTYASTGSPVLTALAMFGGPLLTLLGSATVLSLSDSTGPRRAASVMPIAYTLAFALQALPDLPWGWRFVILAIPFLAGSATSGSTMRLLHDIVPPDGFVLGRATLSIAVGVMQVAGYGFGGLLLVRFEPSTLFLIAAAASAAVVLILRFGLRERPGVASGKGVMQRTREVNRTLLGSPVTRPLYLAMWVPNGIIVGCEALFVPFAGQSVAGYLFAAGAAGMLLGDVVVGRFVPPRHRDRLITPLAALLALPYLAFWLSPSPLGAIALGFAASAGFAASLPLQERLAGAAGPETRGQAFGLYSTGLMLGQAIGALLGGALATRFGPSHAMGTLAVMSLCVTMSLIVGLRRSAPQRPAGGSTAPHDDYAGGPVSQPPTDRMNINADGTTAT